MSTDYAVVGMKLFLLGRAIAHCMRAWGQTSVRMRHGSEGMLNEYLCLYNGIHAVIVGRELVCAGSTVCWTCAREEV